MYLLREGIGDEMRNIRTKYYAEKTGITPNYLSALLNGNQKFTELNAKAILSVYFGISLTDDKMPELLEKYFLKEDN